jgi:hypothetical protein
VLLIYFTERGYHIGISMTTRHRNHKTQQPHRDRRRSEHRHYIIGTRVVSNRNGRKNNTNIGKQQASAASATATKHSGECHGNGPPTRETFIGNTSTSFDKG